MQGCSSNPERMQVQEASEAQRLVFGPPQAVRTQFASQFGACWFDDGGPLGSDYTFTMPEAAGMAEPLLIRIFRLQPEREETFQVQFYPHNDNTVVATRNLGLSAAVSDELEKSVERWLLDPEQCRLEEPNMAEEGMGDTQIERAGVGDDTLQLPPLADPAAEDDEDVDMHQAELRARGAIE